MRLPPSPQHPPNAAPETPEGLQRVDGWFILAVDKVGKRAACRCANCGVVKELAVESIEAVQCDCSRRRGVAANPTLSFAADAARIEGRSGLPPK